MAATKLKPNQPPCTLYAPYVHYIGANRKFQLALESGHAGSGKFGRFFDILIDVSIFA